MRMIAAVLIAGWMSAALAEDIKFVGTWEGFSQPIYTKLIFHDDATLTYCAVQNCRAVQCNEMAYDGDLGGHFAFADELREWTFDRMDHKTIEGLLAIEGGGMGFAVYRPEDEDDVDALSILPVPPAAASN